jgi:hypothetical protein
VTEDLVTWQLSYHRLEQKGPQDSTCMPSHLPPPAAPVSIRIYCETRCQWQKPRHAPRAGVACCVPQAPVTGAHGQAWAESSMCLNDQSPVAAASAGDTAARRSPLAGLPSGPSQRGASHQSATLVARQEPRLAALPALGPRHHAMWLVAAQGGPVGVCTPCRAP